MKLNERVASLMGRWQTEEPGVINPSPSPGRSVLVVLCPCSVQKHENTTSSNQKRQRNQCRRWKIVPQTD